MDENGKGEVWRMNFDGSEKKLFIEGFFQPRAIAIDHYRMRNVYTCMRAQRFFLS